MTTSRDIITEMQDDDGQPLCQGPADLLLDCPWLAAGSRGESTGEKMPYDSTSQHELRLLNRRAKKTF